MVFFTGLDVGMDETSICLVDDKGKVEAVTSAMGHSRLDRTASACPVIAQVV
jgi:hypothetical protein